MKDSALAMDTVLKSNSCGKDIIYFASSIVKPLSSTGWRKGPLSGVKIPPVT